MQALVKYHGLKDWRLRIPYHDSISVNTTSLYTTVNARKGDRGIFISGSRNEDAERRLTAVLDFLAEKDDDREIRIDSENNPDIKAKGVGFSSSAGAAISLSCYLLLKGRLPDFRALSRISRIFAASAARSAVGGFSRLYAGKEHEDTYAEKFADSREMDLRMIIVPLYSEIKTEFAHKDASSSPFFKARIETAQKRCELVENAILSNDLDALGELVEQDTMELHSISMTGSLRIILMTEDSIKIIQKVRELRNDGVKAYFSMQTGPSVFINTEEKYVERVCMELKKMGYMFIVSSVGPEARVLDDRA